MNDELQRTDLKLYAPHALLTTLVVFVLPLGIASWLARLDFHLPFLLTTFACATLSVVFGRVGAKLWQGRPGSRDVVFDDLLLWGYLRRLWLQRCILKHVERLALTRDDPHKLSHQEHLEVLKKLARSIETGDPFTHGHCDRVARHAYMIARAMKLPKSTCEKIRLAAALHDVGKIRTPRHIITKPGRLDDDEYEIIKRHPVDGAAMIAELGDPELEAIVRHHHERMDGTGYPHRLSGDQIPLGAAIIAVADTFDAITSLRPYRAARRHKDAIAILQKEAGTQLHPDVVRAFVTYYTGRRGIRLWASISPMFPGALEHSLAGVQRLAASTAVIAGTATVVAGGALLPGAVFEKTNAAGTKVAHATVTGAQPSGKGATGTPGPSQGAAQTSSNQKAAGAGPKGHKKSHRGAGSGSKESKHKDDSRPEARDDKGKDKDEDNSGLESGDDDSSGSGSGSDKDNSGPGSGGDDDSSGHGSGDDDDDDGNSGPGGGGSGHG